MRSPLECVARLIGPYEACVQRSKCVVGRALYGASTRAAGPQGLIGSSLILDGRLFFRHASGSGVRTARGGGRMSRGGRLTVASAVPRRLNPYVDTQLIRELLAGTS